MATRMQQRRGTASQWTSANPILNPGEIGWESDNNKFKIGDGTNHWDDLEYFVDSASLGTSLGDYIPLTEKGGISGVAELDSSRNILAPANIVFEGTANAHETTIEVTDPTADRTITFPDATGTVALTSDIAELSQDAIDSALTAGTGITKTYNDNANTLTLAVDTTTIQARVADVSDTEIGYLNGVTSAIQTQINDKLSLSGGTMTGAIAMGTNKITGLGTPTDSTDATTKAYVDAITEGLHIHAAVVAATTTNVALATDLENGDTLDGVTLATGNRILVKNQTTTSENGIYVVQASGQPSRATDFDTAAEVDSGDFVFVYSGTVNGSTGWVQTNQPATIGTDPIVFTQFSGAGTYTAGNGLTLTGTVFSINTGTTADLSTSQSLSNKTLESATATTALTLNATAELRLADTDSSHYVGFKAPGTISSNKVWTLPAVDGAAGQALTTDGSGTLSWTSAGGGAAFSELMLIGA